MSVVENERLAELREAYRSQLAHLTAERDEARRQAREAKAAADTARSELASLAASLEDFVAAADRLSAA